MKFFFGLLLGFALGAVVGLLLAPQSGGETLSQLSEQGIQLRSRSGSLSDDLKARAAEAMTQGREIYSRTKDDLTERYNTVKEQM